MKEDIKNVQSLQVNLEGEDLVFNRFGNEFVYNNECFVETVDGSYKTIKNIILSENTVSSLNYIVLTYTDEYNQNLEYETKLFESIQNSKVKNDVDKTNSDKVEIVNKKRVRKYNQIAKKLEEYKTKLREIQEEFVTGDFVVDESVTYEAWQVYNNMVKLLEWVLKIK